MQFKRTHDDQMRALRANPTNSEGLASTVEDAPVQLTRELIDDAIERSKMIAAVRLPKFTVARRAQRAAQAHGSMKAFLRTAAAFQNLPSFARRMRE